ncbi:MAG TPA: glycosyltransferase [Luteibaculaceae bacterium]|nr:glycosyltransferase [Luteibaculaceae bacterium]
MKIALFANFNPVSLSGIVYKTLVSMGNEVFFATPNTFHGEEWPLISCPPLVDVAETLHKHQFEPDLVLFVESSIAPLIFPVGIEKLRVPSAWWAIDNHMNYRWHKNAAHLYSHAFFAMKDFAIKGTQFTGKPIHWLPLACNPLIHRDYQFNRDLKCTFVGNLNPRRKRFFEDLVKSTELRVYSGKNQLEMAHLYAQSVCGFNVAIREDLNMRVFEVMASGAALITQAIPHGLTDLFEPNVHYIPHKISDAAHQINELSHNPEQAREMGQRASVLVSEKHTYQKRMEQLIETVFSDPTLVSSSLLHSYNRSNVSKHRHFRRHIELQATHMSLPEITKLRWNVKNLWENVKFKASLLFKKQL